MSEREPIRPSRWPIGCNWLVLARLILPMTVVLPASMTDRPYLSMPEHGLSVQHYRRLFASSEWLSSFAQSGIVGVASTGIAVIAGVLATVACWQLGSRFSATVRILLLMPLIVPS